MTELNEKYSIESTEIIDNVCEDHEGNCCKSGVSVLVEIDIDLISFHLDFQTTSTYDAGAIDSSLGAYDGTDSYDELQNYCEENDLDFSELLDSIKEESDVQATWNEYIAENYTTNDDHFGGMDANSEYDQMKKR